MEENFGVVVIVINDKSELLLGKRKNAYKAGYYGFPGGRVTSQEKLVAGASRELLEETGLKTDDLEYVGVVREWQDSYTFIHFIYVCKTWQGNVELREPDKCEGWHWVKVNNLPEELLSGHKKALKLFESNQAIFDI